MGQSAYLYRIDKKDFSKIIENPIGPEVTKITKGYEEFLKTHEGLQFVLSKGLDNINKELIEQIFYPKSFVGEKIDFSVIDFENLPDDFDFEQQPVYYNDPENVFKICQLLDTITVDNFQNNFDHRELNKEDIYPYGIWNDETDDNIAFNVSDMSLEFQRLKLIFAKARDHGEYMISFIG